MASQTDCQTQVPRAKTSALFPGRPSFVFFGPSSDTLWLISLFSFQSAAGE